VQLIRHILSLTLVMVLLCSGFPLFDYEDANRDTRVDLEDAILHVRGFSAVADDPESFMPQAERAIATLRVLAGVKANIKPAGDAKSKPSLLSLELLYIPTTLDSTGYSEISSELAELKILYQSISFKPETPPPERLFARAS
jgi:hypothetical protein